MFLAILPIVGWIKNSSGEQTFPRGLAYRLVSLELNCIPTMISIVCEKPNQFELRRKKAPDKLEVRLKAFSDLQNRTPFTSIGFSYLKPT